MLRGFDVSHHQGAIDWADLKRRYDIAFGACKATEGVSFRDSEFPANWAKLADLGMDTEFVRMAYHYGHPASDPGQSAATFLDYVHDLQPTDLLVLDLETGDGLTQTEVNQWAKAWAAHVRKLAPGHSPVLYAGHAYLENNTGVGLNGPYGAWWYPRYPNAFVDTTAWPSTFTPTLPSPNAWGGPPNFWQFTASFLTPDHVLDANVFNGTLDQLRSLNGGDMPLTDADIAKIKAMPISNTITEEPGDTVTLNALLGNDRKRLYDTKVAVNDLAQDVAAIKTKVESLSVAGIDYDLLAGKVADLLAARLQS